MPIPYVKQFDFEYGRLDQLSPLVQRIVARNPGPFTYTGTGVYIVGTDTVAVLDPGPMIDDHFEALKRALDGRKVSHVLVSHGHSDHSPMAQPLADWAGCKTYSKAEGVPTAKGVLGSDDDLGFSPDAFIHEGDVLTGPGWTLDVIETPGHTSNHVCFGLREENACFSGDHIMGWSTTVVSPPDGDMGDYLASLTKIRAMGFDKLLPTHGPPVEEDVDGFIEAYTAHRLEREEAILERLRQGDETIPVMVETIYSGVDKSLHPAACHSVLGHVIKLVREGQVTTPDDVPGVSSQYRLAG